MTLEKVSVMENRPTYLGFALFHLLHFVGRVSIRAVFQQSLNNNPYPLSNSCYPGYLPQKLFLSSRAGCRLCVYSRNQIVTPLQPAGSTFCGMLCLSYPNVGSSVIAPFHCRQPLVGPDYGQRRDPYRPSERVFWGQLMRIGGGCVP